MIPSFMALSYASSAETLSSVLWVAVPVILAILLISVFLRFVPLGLWITSLASGVHVSITSLIGMRLRRVQRRIHDRSHSAAKNIRTVGQGRIKRLTGTFQN